MLAKKFVAVNRRKGTIGFLRRPPHDNAGGKRHEPANMVTTRSQKGATSSPSSTRKYSVILPTYNERDNLPLTTWMLVRTFEEQ